MIKKYPIQQHTPDASHIILSCQQLGGGCNSDAISKCHFEEAQALIELSLERGINVFDHADIYSMGKAETVFGQVLKNNKSLREKMYIQSKCGVRMAKNGSVKHYDLSSAWITESVQGSLKRLNTDYLDVLFLHRPDPLMQLEEVAKCIEKLVDKGLIHHIAVSNMHAGQIAWLQSALSIPIIANQLEMSLFHADFVEESINTNNKENISSRFPRGTLEYCAQTKTQIQAWSPLAQGRYSGNTSIKKRQTCLKTSLLVDALSQEYHCSKEAIVIAWLLRHPTHIQPIIGTRHHQRIIGCMEAGNVLLSASHWYQLFETARGQHVP